MITHSNNPSRPYGREIICDRQDAQSTDSLNPITDSLNPIADSLNPITDSLNPIDLWFRLSPAPPLITAAANAFCAGKLPIVSTQV